jgi:flagellar assembly factor FliW
MKFDTTRFGTIDLPEDRMITMSGGMVGFPDKKRFCIVHHKDNSPFFWFQSLDDPALAFVITNPWLFKPDYAVDLDMACRMMGWAQEDDAVQLECYVIVTVPKGSPEKMTANLIGPLIINTITREAVQMVLSEECYPLKFPLVKKKAA